MLHLSISVIPFLPSYYHSIHNFISE
jgi:hypothetical protein